MILELLVILMGVVYTNMAIHRYNDTSSDFNKLITGDEMLTISSASPNVERKIVDVNLHLKV